MVAKAFSNLAAGDYNDKGTACDEPSKFDNETKEPGQQPTK